MLTEKEKSVVINEVARYEHMSFPNGSNYYKQTLENGTYNTSIGIVEVKSLYGGKKLVLPDGRIEDVSIITGDKPGGDGINYGACYCSRDQVILDLR